MKGSYQQYLDLNRQINELEKKKDLLRNEIMKNGEYTDKTWKVSITPVKRLHLTSIDRLVEKYGRRSLGGLIEEMSFKRLDVRKIS